MFRENKKKVEKNIKKVDAVVTWLILWWIIASVYWIKKYEEKHKNDNKVAENKNSNSRSILKQLIFGVEDSSKNKKPWIIKIFIYWIFHLIKKLIWKTK